MFGSTVSKVARFGVQASRRIGSLVSSQSARKSQVGYAFAIGAVGAASVYLVHKHLNAEETEGGYLYTWFDLNMHFIFRGSGQFGQLGLGSQNDESLPHLVKEIENEKCTYITAGANSTYEFF